MADNPKVTVIDRQTGETRQADAPSITDDFLSGKIGLQPGSTVPVTWDNQIVDIPAERLYDALTQGGGKIAGKTEVLQDEAERSPLRAAAEGSLRSLSFGLSDIVAREAGADPEALAARAATGAAGAGEGAGMLGQLLYGAVGAGIEGTSIGARALQAAMKPTMLVDDLGKLAASRAESALTGIGLKAGASKAIGMGVGGAVEGAVVGGMQGMSEAALGNPDANAEVLLAAAAEGAKGGALFGGGAGLLLGAAAHKLEKFGKSRPVQESAEELDEVLRRSGVDTSAANTSFGDKVARWLGKLTGNEEDVAKLNNRTGQAILAEGEVAVQQSVKHMTDTLDEVRSVAKELDDFSTASRAKLVRDEIPDSAGNAAAAKAADVFTSLRQELDQLDLDSEMLGLGENGGKQLGSKLRAAVDDAEDRIFKAAGVERENGAMGSLGSEPAKRSLSDLATKFDNGRPVAVAVHDSLDNIRAIISQTAKGKGDDIAARFTRASDTVKAALQDGDTFGDAARIHKLMDDAAVKRADVQGFLDKTFRSENGKIIPESVHNHIRNVINVDTDTSVAKLRDFAQSNRDLVQTLHATGADVGALKQVQKRLETFSRQVGDMEKPLRERVGVYNAARRLARGRQQAMAGASNVMTYGIGGAIHEATGLSGAALGVAAGGAFTALTDPARLAVNRARIGAAITRRMEALDQSVQRLVTGGAPQKAAARGSRLTAQMVTGKSYTERAEAFRQRMDEVHNAASPYGQQEREDGGKDFAEAAPEHATALAAKQDLATRLLLSAIPQPLPTPGGLGMRPPTYTDSAIRRFARLDKAIQDPQSIIEDAMNGRVSQEARQVLHTLYPQLTVTVQSRLIEAMDSDKFKLDPSRERAIKLLLTPITQNDMQRMNQLQSVITAQPAQDSTGPKVSPTTDVMSAADQLLQP